MSSSSPARRTPAAAAAYAVLAVADTVLAGHPDPRRRRWRRLTKPLLMPALATAYAGVTSQPGPSTASLRRGVLVAQALSGVGDVALLGRGDRAFLAGLGSFFGAHIAYVATFSSQSRPLSDRSHTAGPTAAAATFVTLGPALGWAAGRRRSALRAPVVAYAGILTAMFAASTRLGDHVDGPARTAVAAGTATFLASDATIALRRFVMRDPAPRSDAVVMATYTIGQALIAAGTAAVVRGPSVAVRR